MNIWLQLGIGVTAAGLIMWLLFLVKKMRTVGRSVYAGLITVAGIALLVCGFIFRKPAEEGAVLPLTQEEQVEFAYAFVEQGEYAVAQELMREYGNRYGYDDVCSLFAARLDLLQGNYVAASGVYERLQAEDAYAEQIAGEYALVQKRANVNLSQAATVRYLTESGKNPADYGYSEDIVTATREGLEVTDEMLREAVLEGILKEYKTKNFKKTAGDVAEAARLYELCQTDYYGMPDEALKAEIETVRKSLKKKMDEGESYCSCVRNALLQMNLLLRDYEEIAENVNEHSTYVELMVAAELYMEDMAREKDFKNTYIGALAEETDRYSDVVGKKVKEIYKDRKSSLSDEKQEELELLVDYWKIEAKHPVLTNIRKLMEDRVREKEVGADASKVYLQLAKIAHYYENEKNRSSRLAEAIDTGSDCDDDEYSEAMQKIYAIINGEGDINEVLNVSDYVERALERALPYGMDTFLQKDGELQLYSNDEEEEEEEEEEEQPEPAKLFSEVFEEYVNKTRSAVNISDVDTESFETVKVRLAVSSDYAVTAERLSKIMKISDCGFEIEEFTVEKLEYTEGRTHLACDVSGSMDGYVDDLRQAVIAYINGRNPKEQLAISTFSSSIEKTMPFGSTKEELTNFANGFYASGGTSIYRTIIEILNNFDSTLYSNNAIILMTDGIDGYTASDTMIAGEMAELAAEKNVKVYTIGLGDVNAAYLTKIAEAGGGVFVHTRESGGLDSLYAFLQGQVDNQYVVTFKAKDTLTARNRLLEISINNGEAKSDMMYSLSIGTNSGQGTSGNTGNTGNVGGNGGNTGSAGGNTGNTGSMGTGSIVMDEKEEALPVSTLRLTGLDLKKIHQNKTGCTNYVRTYAPEFSEDMVGSIRFKDTENPDNQYVVPLKYKDKCVAEFTVPRSLEQGVYDVEVTVNGKKGHIKNGLEIMEMKLDSLYRIGSYEFVAQNMFQNMDGTINLSGNVTLNGWLKFNGPVKIEPNPYDDSYVTVTDACGSKVEFSSLTAVGFGKRMAEEKLPVYLPKLGTFKLYKDAIHTTDFTNYTTDDIAAESFYVAKLFCIPHVSVQLFPDRMEIAYKEVQTKLPFQDVLLGDNKTEKYEVKWEDRKVVLTGENLGVTISYEAKKNDNYPVLNTVVDVSEMEFKIDTIEDEYSFGIMMELLEFPEAGASITLKGGDLDSCSITYDKSYTKWFGQVPITFSGFTFGAEGGDVGAKLKNKEFHKITYVGAMDISTGSVTEMVPKLKKFFGKDAPSLLKMPETTLKLTPSPFCISGNATLKLLETVELANAAFNLGQFKYTNELLEIKDVTTVGVNAKLGLGFKWEEDDAISLSIGAAGVLNVHSKFTGVQVEDAHVEAKLDWWILDYEVDKHADVLLGFTESEFGGAQFNVILATRDGNKSKKDWFYINEKQGKEIRHS